MFVVSISTFKKRGVERVSGLAWKPSALPQVKMRAGGAQNCTQKVPDLKNNLQFVLLFQFH